MSLTSLPPELLQEILNHIEHDEDLYNLGLTCRHTHQPAFTTFLKKHKIDDPMDMYHYFSAYQYPPLLLPVIQASLWIKDIKHIHCGLNPGYDRIWNDLQGLRTLVGRMPRVETMRLSLRYLDAWTSLTGTSQEDLKVLDRVEWAKCVTKLLDAVIERGCLTLDVNGGVELERFYVEEEPDAIMEVASLRPSQVRAARKIVQKKLTSSFNKMVPKIFRRPQRLPLPGPSLRSVTLCYSMMFQYSFYPWTLKMFTKNSSTITRLSLNTPNVSREIISHFLSSITLPQLYALDIATFVYQHPVTTTHAFMFSDLVAFFERHPSIETVDLQGVERPETPHPPVLKTRILPRLKRIVAHPVWISTLVGFLDRSPDAFPLIESIGITTEYATYADFSDEERAYELINDTLARIARASFPRPITLELELTSKRGMLEWFDEHTSLGKESSIISSLSCVSALVLTTRFYVRFGKEEVYHLLGCLALFPELRRVIVTDVRRETDGYCFVNDKPLLRRIASECPLLEMVNNINLGTILDGSRENTDV